jgi:hypothetical protein
MNEKLAKGFIYVALMMVLFPLIIIPLVIYSGWAISTSWNWLMVPIFGIRDLSIFHGAAIALIVGYLTHELPDRDDEKQLKLIAWLLIRPLAMVGFAWILKHYI